MHSLTFLDGDLKVNDPNKDKPVVIVQHCPMDYISSSDQQRLNFMLHPYRVVAVLYGHNHGPLSTDQYPIRQTYEGQNYDRVYNTVHPGSLGGDGAWLSWSDITLTEGTCSVMTIQGHTEKEPRFTNSSVVQFPDLDKPITTAQAQRVQGGNCPTRVTLTAVDPPDSRNWGCSSGVREIQYQLNGTAEYKWKTYKDTPPLIVPAGTTVYYRAVDLAGGPSDSPYRDSKLDNVEDWQQLRIDTCHTYLPTIRR